MRTYLIAFTLRNGSTLLCDYLTQNGMGSPTEYFQYPFGEANRWAYQALGVPTDDFVGYLRELRAQAPNGIFGAKLTWDHKLVLLENARRLDPKIQELEDLFPGVKWIFVQRRDKIAQAISLWRAVKTGRWHSLDPKVENAQLEYDYFGIIWHLFTILFDEYLWEDYFQRRGLQPATVYYENLVRDPNNTIMQLVNYIQGQEKIIKNRSELKLDTQLTKMRDDFSGKIKSAFMEDSYHILASNHWKPRREIVERWLDFFRKERWKEGEQTNVQQNR